MAFKILLLLACLVVYIQAHGLVRVPPNRASLWRYGYDSPRNLDDNGMNCGGFGRQYTFNGGKCGICGDPYDEPQPRLHELGGKYGKGIIVANYTEGQIITINAYLSAAHLGSWELRISPDPYCQEQECFDGYLLELVDGGTKYYLKRGSGSYDVAYRLPAELTCEHCVLQWMYTSGNNGGRCEDGTRALGCGPQEMFFSCVDISISASKGSSSNDFSTATPVEPSTQNSRGVLKYQSKVKDREEKKESIPSYWHRKK